MQIEIQTKRITIDRVSNGDYVKSYDHDDNKVVYRKVTDIFSPQVPHEKQAKIVFDGGQQVTSESHRMWILRDHVWDYIQTKDVVIGDCVLTDDDRAVVVLDVQFGKQTEQTEYRDLTVEGNHNYFVAESETAPMILGHNSATVHFPFWHSEIEDIIVLKNNKGTEDSRVRRLDYSIQFNRLFYQRVMADKDIALFSPHAVEGLYESMGDNDKFEKMYLKYEKDASLVEGTVNARSLLIDIIKERIETGRIYFMNMDHCNTHSSFTMPIYMSNLCQEVTLPTTPIQSFDDPNGEIALCILSAINLGKIDPNRVHEQMKERCDLAVRALDELIDIQEYPLPAAKNATIKRRSLGIGYIGLAHFLAKNKVQYGSHESLELVDRVTESLQYHLIKASVKLAEEKGPCEGLHETKYGQGLLPIDTYNKKLDDVCNRELELDWEALRVDLKNCGIRNSTLTAQMPSESSSVVSNETNGIEVPRDVVQRKKSKLGILKMMVPEYRKCKDHYVFAYDEEYRNDDYMKIAAIIQKYFDQAISVNQYYNPEHYPDNKIPVQVVMRNLLLGYSLGMKTAYYLNTYDGKEEQEDEHDENEEQPQGQTLEQRFGDGCDSGACAI